MTLKLDHKRLLGFRIEKADAVAAKKGSKSVQAVGSKGSPPPVVD